MALPSSSFGQRLWHSLAFGRIVPSAMPSPQTTTPERRDATWLSRFEAFYWQYEHVICQYLRRMVGDEEVVFDLSQETFIRAWQHFDSLLMGTARAWLYRVATNLALTFLQKHAAHPLAELEETLPGASDPGRRIGEQDLITTVLQSLTPKQRSALLLYEVHGLSCAEIGHLLGLSHSATKGILFRAREQFRQRYLHEEEDE